MAWSIELVRVLAICWSSILHMFFFFSGVLPGGASVWVPRLRIDPLRLLAGCRKRRLNQAPLDLRGFI